MIKNIFILVTGLNIISACPVLANQGQDVDSDSVLQSDFINLQQKSVPKNCLDSNLQKTRTVMLQMALTSVVSKGKDGSVTTTECWNEQINLSVVKSKDTQSVFGGKILINVNPRIKAVRWNSEDVIRFTSKVTDQWAEKVGFNEALRIRSQLEQNKIYPIELENTDLKNTKFKEGAVVTYTRCFQDFKKGPLYIGVDFYYVAPNAGDNDFKYTLRALELRLQDHLKNLPRVVNNKCLGNQF